MDAEAWTALAIAIPAATFLLVICIIAATRLGPAEARHQQSALIFSIFVLMLGFGTERYIPLGELPVIGWIVGLGYLAAGVCVLYTTVIAATFLFRPRYREIGFRMLVICTLTLWWFAQNEPTPSSQQDQQAIDTTPAPPPQSANNQPGNALRIQGSGVTPLER